MSQVSLRFHQRKTKIESLLRQAKSVESDELQNELARYICIRISGLIETTVRDCYVEYVKSRCAPDVAQYVGQQLKRFQNPDMDKLIDLARGFNEKWSSELENIDSEIKEAVISVVATRNSVAHGGDQGIRLITVGGYYHQVIRLLLIIQNQCKISEN